MHFHWYYIYVIYLTMQGVSLSIGVHSIIIRGVSIDSVLLNMYIPHYISIHHIERMNSSTRMAVSMWNLFVSAQSYDDLYCFVIAHYRCKVCCSYCSLIQHNMCIQCFSVIHLVTGCLALVCSSLACVKLRE